MGYVELVQDFPYGLVNDVIYSFGFVIKRRDWRQYYAAHFRHCRHVSQMAKVERGFSHYL